MKKVTAFIPIKLNNERTPGKNTRRFADGTPLCHLIQKTLLQVPEIDDIYVFCSDETICEYLLPGVRFIKRDKVLDSSSTLIGEVIGAFIQAVPSDVYVMAHATAPFIKAERFSEGIRAVLSAKNDSAFACRRIADFLWSNGEPLNFKRDSIPRTQDLPLIYAENSSMYVFMREIFEKHHARVGFSPHFCECSEIESIDVDWPEDFMIADAVYTHIINNKK